MNHMFTRVLEKCPVCNKTYAEFATDPYGIPLYYIGNGDGTFSLGSPMKPNNADKYFCGPQCASKFIRENK